MHPENHDDTTLRAFPVPERLFDENNAPRVGYLTEALRIFRNVAGYELRFIRAGSREAILNPSVMETRRDDESVSPFKRIATFPVGATGIRVYGVLRLSRDKKICPLVDWDAACSLASLLSAMLAENSLWREELARREGELAALTIESDEENKSCSNVSDRLRDVLRSGAAALGGFCAAGLYLLDPATTVLKTRSVWGLPEDRYLEPPRPLKGARAEVEALLGSAVTLNDDYLAEVWRAPELFSCSVCIPVVSETTILGVAWFFSDERHTIGSRELETLDLVAWRLVDELEKESALIERRPRADKKREARRLSDEETSKWTNARTQTKK